MKWPICTSTRLIPASNSGRTSRAPIPSAAIALSAADTKSASALERVEDPFSLDASGENAALRQWGKPGREYIRLLNELTDCDFDSHFKHPPQGTLLARLQESVLCREPEASPASPLESLPNDESIRFLACPGIRREVEIVADSIWSLIRDDEKRGGSDPLRFHQIGVLIPDAELDSYLPHVETVFTQRHQIPLDLVDRPFSGAGRVVEAVELLLALPMGHFARDEVFHLVTHPALIGTARVDTEQMGAMVPIPRRLFRSRRARTRRYLHPAQSLPLGPGVAAACARSVHGQQMAAARCRRRARRMGTNICRASPRRTRWTASAC